MFLHGHAQQSVSLCRSLTRSRLLLVMLAMFYQLVALKCRGADDRAPAHAWKRWAVIVSPEVDQSGLTDLLTVGLSETHDIQLVERLRLEQVLAEQELSVLVESAGAGATKEDWIMGPM